MVKVKHLKGYPFSFKKLDIICREKYCVGILGYIFIWIIIIFCGLLLGLGEYINNKLFF
jgi:hypothetical protein